MSAPPPEKPLLGFVLLHPPKFDDALRLLASLRLCKPTRQLELAFVFSSAEDERELRASAPDFASHTDLRVHPVVLDRPWPGHDTPYPSVVAFKRFYSVAQLLDASDAASTSGVSGQWPGPSFRARYDYAVLFDSELEVFSCAEVGRLPSRVREVDARGVAYAHASCVEKMANRTRGK